MGSPVYKLVRADDAIGSARQMFAIQALKENSSRSISSLFMWGQCASPCVLWCYYWCKIVWDSAIEPLLWCVWLCCWVDQCDQFWWVGLRVAFVGSCQDDHDALMQVHDGQAQLIYISPEQLLATCNDGRCFALKYTSITFVVDEAHTVSKW